MSNGLPCIAFDCDTGPRHIIREGRTGLLIEKENVTGMATAITALLQDSDKRRSMSVNALTAVKEFFPGKIYEQWEALFAASIK
jgi:glycosyltransferase involved in cell wall biosynthesis